MNLNAYDLLSRLDISEAKDIPFENIWTYARLAKVIDGDTVSVVILIGTFPLKLNVRILGIDCPESSRRQTKDEVEITAGKKVTEYVKRNLPSIVEVRLTGKDKYCRFLGDIRTERITSLSEHLLEKKYCKKYNGTGPKVWSREELMYIIEKA